MDGFKQTLHQFLHNGFVLRKDLLDPIIQKLKDLHRHIQSHDTYRFYSSSLLIMYDSSSQDDHPGKGLGNDKAGPGSNPVDVRMIDFAHSTHSGFQNDTTVHSGPDQGYLYGLKNLIDVFTDMRWVVVLGKLIILSFWEEKASECALFACIRVHVHVFWQSMRTLIQWK